MSGWKTTKPARTEGLRVGENGKDSNRQGRDLVPSKTLDGKRLVNLGQSRSLVYSMGIMQYVFVRTPRPLCDCDAVDTEYLFAGSQNDDDANQGPDVGRNRGRGSLSRGLGLGLGLGERSVRGVGALSTGCSYLLFLFPQVKVRRV